ncbi:hypothetical protein NDJ21_22720 [Vibrio alginolyticus]|nr:MULTISPECIES: hypothetical protein [Gammaproteobacteria]MCK8113425.1 hypothetical protein [Vibrio sp. 2CM40D]MDF4321550.1 hypothetical protein [Vibrio parahaemolyticus]MDP2635142.1 hypothetical protein [Pseudoalteromonas sp. 1_MG-2023]MCK8113788.1 hypothetical protein [Vibrio sp. 2CM40D]MCS0230817.1 hypothetical protein [Vibrio alginolyticus]
MFKVVCRGLGIALLTP